MLKYLILEDSEKVYANINQEIINLATDVIVYITDAKILWERCTSVQ